MEHRDVDTLRQLAEVKTVAPLMSRREKLERWAEVIEAAGPQRFQTFYQFEYAPSERRAEMRQDGSPFALAYADPGLREAGLEGDRYGDALTFFEISEREAHALFCSCLNGGTVRSEHVASELRRMADQGSSGAGGLSRLTAVAALALLLPLFAPEILF